MCSFWVLLLSHSELIALPLLYTFWLEKRCIGWGREWNSFYLFVQMHGIWREWKWNRLKKRIIVNYISLYRWVFTLSSIVCDHLIWLAPDMVQLAYFEQNTVIMMNNFGWFIYIILLNIVFDHSLFSISPSHSNEQQQQQQPQHHTFNHPKRLKFDSFSF